MGVGILVPAGNTRHRNDGLQTLYASRGQSELCGTGIRTASHTHFAVGPIGLHGNIAGLIRVSHTVAMEPFNDALKRINFQIGATGLKPFGVLGAQTAAFYNSISANQIIIIPGQILHPVALLPKPSRATPSPCFPDPEALRLPPWLSRAPLSPWQVLLGTCWPRRPALSPVLPAAPQPLARGRKAGCGELCCVF